MAYTLLARAGQRLRALGFGGGRTWKTLSMTRLSNSLVSCERLVRGARA
jgi:hypothetical protein